MNSPGESLKHSFEIPEGAIMSSIVTNGQMYLPISFHNASFLIGLDMQLLHQT